MKHIAVIGGGVVGLTTAWALINSGFRVSLLERTGTVAGGASHANGGQLSYRYVSPLADAGIPLKAMSWLCKADSPLSFRPELKLAQWSWMASFLAKCTSNANRRTTEQLLRLGILSQSRFDDYCTTPTMSALNLRAPGKLVVYRQAAEFTRAAATASANAGSDSNTNSEITILSGRECAVLEPALSDVSPRLAGGIFTHNEAVADCRAFCFQLLTQLQSSANFSVSTNAEASGFVSSGNRVTAIKTRHGDIEADEIVIAAGLHSVALAASVGIRLPIYPLKGYSLSVPIGAQHRAPEVSVTDFEQKVLYARIGDQLRVAAMVDLVGDDASLDASRLAALHRMVRATMPHAADYDQAVPWAGLRPATPGGAPILGKTSRSGLWLNVGHGPLGFTFASGSADILAALISGRESPIPLDGLTLAAA